MKFILRLIKLFFGLFLYAVGIIITINANIGYAPWDIFHVGISLTTGVKLGMVSILIGFIVLIISIIMGENVGIGTIANMIFIGLFIDWIIYRGFIPMANNLHTSIIMLIIGLVIICFATYFYIDSGFGAGPRDSLMVAIAKKTKLPIGASRALIEFIVSLTGYFLGGMLGIGTVICVLITGAMMQLIFKFLKFDPQLINHENLKDTFDFFVKK